MTVDSHIRDHTEQLKQNSFRMRLKNKPSCVLVSRFVRLVNRTDISQRRDKDLLASSQSQLVWQYYYKVKKVVAQDSGVYNNVVALKKYTNE